MSLSIEEKIGKNLFKFNYSKQLTQHNHTSPDITPKQEEKNDNKSNNSPSSILTISDALFDKQIDNMEEHIENLLIDDPSIMESSFKLKETFPSNDDLINSLDDIHQTEMTKTKPQMDPMTELFTTRDTIILRALLNFDRENTEININHFSNRLPDFSEGINKQKEIELFSTIETMFQNYFSKNARNIHMYKKIFIPIEDKQNSKEMNHSFCVIVVKDLIVAAINSIKDWIEKKITMGFTKDANEDETDDNGIEIFVEIYNQYTFMITKCTLIEKDFKNYFDNLRITMNITFSFPELFRDIFWDFIFRIKVLNCRFVNYFGEKSEADKVKMDIVHKIVDVLWHLDFPYKRTIGELFSITCILNERIHLSNFIIDMKDKTNRKNNAFNHSLLFDNSLNIKKNKILCDIEHESNPKESITEKKQNNIPQTVKPQSIDELYNYIVNDPPNSKRTQTKKKNKKKNKKKKENSTNSSNNTANSSKEIDPIVDQFKSELCTKVINANNIQKIKPNISDQWLQSIALNP